MGGLDKKVLKVISTQEDMDYDVDDISIALKCDDDEVQEALDSLKDQGLIEAVIHNGKKFWKPAKAGSYLKSDEPDVRAKDDSSIDLLILEQPARSFKMPEQQARPQQRPPQQPTRQFNPFEQVAQQQQHAQEYSIKPPLSSGRPMKHTFENEIVDDNTKTFVPPRTAKPKAETPMNTFEDDDDDFVKPKRSGSAIGPMVIAIIISAGISALITLALTNNATKGLSGNLAAMETKINDAGSKLNQRIDAISVKVDNIKTDLAAKPTVTAPVQESEVKSLPTKSVSKQSMKSAKKISPRKPAAKRQAAAPAKKKKTAAEMIQETSESSSASTDASASSSSTSTEPASSSEPAASSSSSAGESPSATSESSPSPAPEPSSSASSGTGGIWEGSAPASSDGSASGQ
jgi:hypothetical protein